MGESSIPVDLFNPGQVFACLGFLEAADILCGDAEGGFDWSDDADVRFYMQASREGNPFAHVLGFLAGAKILTVSPSTSNNRTQKWNIPTKKLARDDAFPYHDPATPATLPAILEGPRISGEDGIARLVMDYWGDATRRDAVKFWAGSGGYPGAALARDALDLVRDRCHNASSDPFGLWAEQSSSFRFDWRRDYIPIDAGFSLNTHSGRIAAVGFPLVEILAGLGLGNARPKKLDILEYCYGVIGICHGSRGYSFYHPILLRAALGNSSLPFPRRSFLMRLGWPGKEGQARAITGVTEETIT